MHLRGLQVDEHLAGDAAGDIDAPHAVYVLQALHDHLLGHRRELAQGARVGVDRERDDRLRVVEVAAQHQRILHLARESRAHERDLVAHVLDRAFHVGVEAELDVGLAAALPRVRADRLHAVDRVDHLLDRLVDVVLDRFRRRARVLDLDEGEWDR
jgi:hypothetical protein